MVYIVSIIYAYIFIRLLGKLIKKKPGIVYLITLAVGIYIVLADSEALWKKFGFLGFQFLLHPIYSASFATALFFFIMYCTVMPAKWKIAKITRGSRTELSIIASILTLTHNIYYGFVDHKYFIALFKNPGLIDRIELVSTIISFISVLLLIPLFITSFPKIRKKMSGKNWLKIQKLAYPFWSLILIHASFIYIAYSGSYFEEGGIYLINAVLSLIVYPLTLIIWLLLKFRQKKKISS